MPAGQQLSARRQVIRSLLNSSSLVAFGRLVKSCLDQLSRPLSSSAVSTLFLVWSTDRLELSVEETRKIISYCLIVVVLTNSAFPQRLFHAWQRNLHFARFLLADILNLKPEVEAERYSCLDLGVLHFRFQFFLTSDSQGVDAGSTVASLVPRGLENAVVLL